MSKKQRNFNLVKWFFLIFGFQNEKFSKNETWILFYFRRTFQCFLQIFIIRIPSRVISKKQQNFNLEKWFFLFFRFQNKYFSKNETSILFFFLRAFQCFLQISKIQTLSRVMSKKHQNSTFSKSFIIQKQYEESFWKFNTSIL